MHGHLPPADIDPDRIAQVMDNLLTNAIKYGQPATPVVVDLAAGEGEVSVAVTNQGQGILRDDLPRLFHRFERSETAKHGTAPGVGLGLYITRGSSRRTAGGSPSRARRAPRPPSGSRCPRRPPRERQPRPRSPVHAFERTGSARREGARRSSRGFSRTAGRAGGRGPTGTASVHLAPSGLLPSFTPCSLASAPAFACAVRDHVPRRAVSTIASITAGQAPSGRSWPMPGMTSSFAPGIARAVASPPDT